MLNIAEEQSIRGDQYLGKLHVGQIVECILYGGMFGYISKIDGEQQPETIKSLSWGGVMGGNANITVHFDGGYDSVVPECIIRGVQWFIGTEPLTESIVVECMNRAIDIDRDFNDSVKRKAAEQAAKLKQRAQEHENLPKEYSYLETVKDYEKRTGKNYCGRICAAKNIRKELARSFPGIKFSVTSDTFSGGNSIDVRWNDGPTTEAVDHITEKYNDHVTDYSGDFRDPTNCVFNELYGGSKYVSTRRDISPETYQAIKPWADDQILSGSCWADKSTGCWENLVYKLIRHYNIPLGSIITGVKRIEGVMSGCDINDFYELTFAAEQPKEVKPSSK